MALIKCPECGKEISNRASICIQCGCPISIDVPKNGKIIIKAQPSPVVDVTVRQLTFDIFTTQGQKLCTIEPGRVATVEIDSDTEIFAIPTYGLDFAKERRKTNSIRVYNHKTTRIQLAFVRVALGMSIKALLNEIDVIDSE